MKHRYLRVGILAAALLSAPRFSQGGEWPDASSEKVTFASNRCYSKGGLGIVDDHLYIVVKSPKNQMLMKTSDRWVGLDASKWEVAIFFEGRMWSPPLLPEQFDLSKAVVVSFEGDKVRFFDFRSMSGGYYSRFRD